MKTEIIKQYILSKDDLRKLRQVSNCVFPYIEQLSVELKVINILENDLTYSEQMRDNALDLFKKATDYVTNKINEYEPLVSNMPETSNGLIARPKDSIQHIIDNLKLQLKFIEEGVKVFN